MGVFKRKSKDRNGKNVTYWYIRFWVNGREVWRSIGKAGDVTRSVAEARLAEEKKKLKRGVFDYEDKTLEEIEEEYISYIKNVKRLRTWKSRALHLRTLKSFFKDKSLSQITARDIDKFKTAFMKTRKPASVNRTLATLRNIFNMAKVWKYFYGDNPVSVSGLLTEDNYRDRVLSLEEQNRLLECAPEHLEPIIVTALHTGMRKGELLTLTWSNVDFDNRVLIVDALNNKSKRVKKVPLNKTLLTMLKKLKLKNGALSEYVFLSHENKPMKEIKTSFNSACKRSGIKGLTFHDLRTSAATRMIESGVGVVETARILGNSSVEMTMRRYVRPDESLRNAVDRLEAFNNGYGENRSKKRSSDNKEA